MWVVDVDAPEFLALGEAEDMAPLVSEADEARASAMLDPAAGTRLRARRVFLRLILARYVARAPSDVHIVTAPGGKPVLLPRPPGASTVAFSVGHSGSLYVVAVASCSSLGVDVERLRPVQRAAAIAERWFGPDESNRLAGLDGDDMDRAFMELWTAKEALAKRHGAGLRLMKGQGAAPDVHRELDVERERRRRRLARLALPSGYCGALASTDEVTTVDVISEGDIRWII